MAYFLNIFNCTSFLTLLVCFKAFAFQSSGLEQQHFLTDYINEIDFSAKEYQVGTTATYELYAEDQLDEITYNANIKNTKKIESFQKILGFSLTPKVKSFFHDLSVTNKSTQEKIDPTHEIYQNILKNLTLNNDDTKKPKRLSRQEFKSFKRYKNIQSLDQFQQQCEDASGKFVNNFEVPAGSFDACLVLSDKKNVFAFSYQVPFLALGLYQLSVASIINLFLNKMDMKKSILSIDAPLLELSSFSWK